MSNAPLITNPNDEEQLDKALEKEKIREKIRAQAWRAVLSTADGRQVIREILVACHVDGIAADVNNAYTTYMMLGEQNVGNWLKVQIDVFHADAFWQMKQEDKKRMEV